MFISYQVTFFHVPNGEPLELDLHCIKDAAREIRKQIVPWEYAVRRWRSSSRLIRQPNLSQPSSRPGKAIRSWKGHLRESPRDRDWAFSINRRQSLPSSSSPSLDLIEDRALGRYILSKHISDISMTLAKNSLEFIIRLGKSQTFRIFIIILKIWQHFRNSICFKIFK